MSVRLKMTRLLVCAVLSCYLSATDAHLIKITEDNWRDLLEGEWMVEL